MLNRTAFGILIFSVMAALAAYILVPTFSDYQSTSDELHEARRRLLERQADNQKLKYEIQMLRSDARTIERVARDKFGYVMPNETVYDFSKPLPDPQARAD